MTTVLNNARINALQELINTENYTQFYADLYSYGSEIAGLYISGPTGQGIFGNYSHETVGSVIGHDEFEAQRDTISNTIANGLLDLIRSTEDSGNFNIPSNADFLKKEIDLFTNPSFLNLPTEAYPGHDLIDFVTLWDSGIDGAIDQFVTITGTGRFLNAINENLAPHVIHNGEILTLEEAKAIGFTVNIISVGGSGGHFAQVIQLVYDVNGNQVETVSGVFEYKGEKFHQGQLTNIGGILYADTQALGSVPVGLPMETVIGLVVGLDLDPNCFPADTLIAMWDGSQKQISAVRLKDTVRSFDANGTAYPGAVTNLYHGETSEWIKLNFTVDGEARELVATPGHPFLQSDGSFALLADLVDAFGNAEIITQDGKAVEAVASRVVYSSETAHLFEEAYQTSAIGNLALKPQPIGSWATYNFEVENTHTYVAEGICVHNRCDQYSVNDKTLAALIGAGIVDPETDIITTASDGQHIIIKDGEALITEGALEGQPFVVALEVIGDYVRHIGDAIESVLDDTSEYLAGALPGLLAALINGENLDEAVEAYGAQVIAEMGIDGLSRIFGLERLEELDFPIDPETGQMQIPDNLPPEFFETEIGAALKGALVSAAVMNILNRDDLNSEDYEQLALNHSVRFVVTQALQTQNWATLGNVTERFTDWFGFDDAAVNLTPAASAGAAAAVALIVDIIDGGIENPGQALVGAGIAAGTAYLSGIVTQAVVGQAVTIAGTSVAYGGLITIGAQAGSIVPIVGTIIGAVIGLVLGKLFGGLFSPPPPLFNVTQNDDGSVTVHFTEHSGGYIYSARDGQDDDITGSNGSDSLIGSSGDNQLNARDGNDLLQGQAGDDVLIAGDGNDIAHGGEGNDQVFGGRGHDLVNGGDGNDVVIGGDGNDILFGDSIDDEEDADFTQRSDVETLGELGDPEGGDTDEDEGAAEETEEIADDESDATHNDVLLAGAGNDKAFGGQGDDFISGSFGDDVLMGQTGDDVVYGGAHNDFLDGGQGDDVLDGDAGSDELYGGSGDDVIHGDKMVTLKDTPVTTALILAVESLAAGSDAFKELIGLDAVYDGITDLETKPFDGTLSLKEALVQKIASVEQAFILGLEGETSDIFTDVMSWLTINDPNLKAEIEAGAFEYLASNYVAPIDTNASSLILALVSEAAMDGVPDVLSALLDLVPDSAPSVDVSDALADLIAAKQSDTPTAELELLLAGDNSSDVVDALEPLILASIVAGDNGILANTISDLVFAAAADGNTGLLVSLQNLALYEAATNEGAVSMELSALVTAAGADEPITALQDLSTEASAELEALIAELIVGGVVSEQTDQPAPGQMLLTIGEGNDLIDAGDGNDLAYGGFGNDTILGGAGDDVIYGDGIATSVNDAGASIIENVGSGDDVIDGGAGNDQITAGDGDNIVDGGAGDDRIFAGSGADIIRGGAGADIIMAGDGDDLIYAGASGVSSSYLELAKLIPSVTLHAAFSSHVMSSQIEWASDLAWR